MDIQYTLLGLLNWQPLSGYDLKKIIAESELFYWSGNNNQIYNSLVELHKRGLVDQTIAYQESLPAKKIYTLTAAGRATLRQWLLSNPELPEFRNHFLIQLAWMDELAGDELDTSLARYAEEIKIQLQMQKTRLTRPHSKPDRSPREQFLWARIEENLLAMYQRELEWVEQLRQDLHKEQYHRP